MDTALTSDGEVRLELQQESTIKEDGWYARSVRGLAGGLLLVHGEGWKPGPEAPARGPWCNVSRDNGDTWVPYDPSDGLDYTRVPVNACRRKDGSVIGWDGAWNLQTPYRGIPGQPIAQTILRARSWEEMARGRCERVETTVQVPYTVPGMGDDLSRPPSYSAGIWGKLLEADHGYLLQAAYGFFDSDRAPRLWQEQKQPAVQYRTWIVYSRDAGGSWHYLSTVASSVEYPLPVQAEGHCEPDLLYLGDGRLLCVMRTGGNPTGTHMERFTPLVACRSVDGGLSWTPPVPIAPYGVKPVLLRMSDGLIVCLAGRPGFYLIFSGDEGRTWSTLSWITPSSGRWGRSSSGYGELIELRPDVLGVVYDEYIGAGDEGRMVTKLRRYQVRRC